MNSDPNLTQGNEVWTQFEQRLRGQRLGPATDQRDTILYECGFAAGVAEAYKESSRRTIRWQAVGLAAAVLAAASLTFPFVSGKAGFTDRFGMSPRVQATPQSEETEMRSSENAWLKHLTHDRQVDVRSTRVLRVSSSLEEVMSAVTLGEQVEDGQTQLQSAPLRATDADLLL